MTREPDRIEKCKGCVIGFPFSDDGRYHVYPTSGRIHSLCARNPAPSPSPEAPPATANSHAPYCCADAKAGGPDHSMDCQHFAVPASPDLRGALVEAKEALEQVWAAIGDRLLGKGPLSKEYAHGVTQKVNAALEHLRFILAIPAPPSAPVAPSLLPRVLAALEWADCFNLAAELRRYIAEMEKLNYAGVRVLVEPCEVGGHYRNENGVTFHPSKCAAPRSGEGEGK